MIPERTQTYNPKGHRPYPNGAPAWLQRVLITNWVDTLFPVPKVYSKMMCQKCNAETLHSRQILTNSTRQECGQCGLIKYVNKRED